MTGNYQIGDRVICSRDFAFIGQMVKGKVLTVIATDHDAPYSISEEDLTVQIQYVNSYPNSFLMAPEDVSPEPEVLGVYRPNLEDRKVGKIGVHMTIDGFPNALMEVSRVMQWAADVKGYKLHDWKNLPEPENGFAGAGYRHMLEASMQKALNIPASERVDHESNLLHLAHQAFNILAQIELIKTGKIT